MFVVAFAFKTFCQRKGFRYVVSKFEHASSLVALSISLSRSVAAPRPKVWWCSRGTSCGRPVSLCFQRNCETRWRSHSTLLSMDIDNRKRRYKKKIRSQCRKLLRFPWSLPTRFEHRRRELSSNDFSFKCSCWHHRHTAIFTRKIQIDCKLERPFFEETHWCCFLKTPENIRNVVTPPIVRFFSPPLKREIEHDEVEMMFL